MRRRKTTTVSKKGWLLFTKVIMGRSISTRKKKVVRQAIPSKMENSVHYH